MDEDKGTPKKTSNQLMLSIGMEFFAGICVGLLFGYGIDHFFNTKPWGMIIMILLGAAAGFRNILKIQNPEESVKDLASGKNIKHDE